MGKQGLNKLDFSRMKKENLLQLFQVLHSKLTQKNGPTNEKEENILVAHI